MDSYEHSLPNLLCDEPKDEIFELGFEESLDFDIERIEALLQSETNWPHLNACDASVKIDGSWLKSARIDAIKWILDKRDLFGFQYRTVYLSLIYFDRFFSRRSIDNGKLWAVRLLSIACLSLAAKMEEYKAPLLSEYSLDEFSFSGNVIQRMELLVLSTLEWKMNYVTPISYLGYFISKFDDKSRHKELIVPSIKLIFTLMKDINAIEFRPSSIAASAVLAAFDIQVTKTDFETKLNEVPSFDSLGKEHVFTCYCLLQDIEMSKSKTPKSLISTTLGVLGESTTVKSTVGIKRRLTYIDDGDRPKKSG